MPDFRDLDDARRGRFLLRLEGLELVMGLGIHPEERAAPQRVRVDVHLYCDYRTTPPDAIDAVVDYDFLRADIRRLTATRHFELQETLCEEIAALALRDPRVAGVRVRSMKPDIYPDARIGCEILRRRPGGED